MGPLQCHVHSSGSLPSFISGFPRLLCLSWLSHKNIKHHRFGSKTSVSVVLVLPVWSVVAVVQCVLCLKQVVIVGSQKRGTVVFPRKTIAHGTLATRICTTLSTVTQQREHRDHGILYECTSIQQKYQCTHTYFVYEWAC